MTEDERQELLREERKLANYLAIASDGPETRAKLERYREVVAQIEASRPKPPRAGRTGDLFEGMEA